MLLDHCDLTFFVLVYVFVIQHRFTMLIEQMKPTYIFTWILCINMKLWSIAAFPFKITNLNQWQKSHHLLSQQILLQHNNWVNLSAQYFLGKMLNKQINAFDYQAKGLGTRKWCCLLKPCLPYKVYSYAVANWS